MLLAAVPPASNTEAKLAKIFLPKTKMQAKAQHQECAYRFGRGLRMTPRARHPRQYFLGDLAIFTDRALSFKDGQYRFERIAMDLRDALNILLPVQGVDDEAVADSIPILTGSVDFICRNQVIDRLQRVRKVWILPHPTRLFSSKREREVEHIDLPARVEAAALLAPMEIPVPDRREEQHRETQVIGGDAKAANIAIRRRAKSPEHKSEVFQFLRRRFLAPHALAKQA